jgi:hypothetical protein
MLGSCELADRKSPEGWSDDHSSKQSHCPLSLSIAYVISQVGVQDNHCMSETLMVQTILKGQKGHVKIKTDLPYFIPYIPK